MVRKDLIDLLLKIEREQPVHKWVLKGVHIWPILKKDLFFTLTQEQSSSQSIKSKKKTELVLLVLKSLVYNIKLLLQSFDKKDFIYLGYWAYRVDYNEKFINKFFYPLNRSDNSLYLEYDDSSNNIFPKKHISIYTASFFLKFLYSLYFSNKNIFQPISIVEGYFEFTDLKRLKKVYRSSIITTFAYYKITKLLLKRIRPKEVLGLCYYNNQVFGSLCAANSLNIKTYDIQHGGQGSLHSMYSFNNFPDKGFNTLPRVFWVWDKPSLNHIRTWLPVGNFHTVEMRGNPWIDFILVNSHFHFDDSKKILYTMQQDFLDEYIIETIKNDINVEWWIRLHPRMMNAYSNIVSQLEKNNIVHKVNLKDSNSLPLPIILKNVDIHISKFSGSIIESELVGTKTIILESIGVTNFQEYIKWGLSIGLENPTAQKLTELILQNLK